MRLIDWLIDDSLTGATVGCCPHPLCYFLSLSPCFHTFILLSLLNIPSSLLSSGPFYFLFVPLSCVLFCPQFSLLSRCILFYFFSSITFFWFLSVTPFVFLIPCPFCSVLFFLRLSRLFRSVFSSILCFVLSAVRSTFSSLLTSVPFYSLRSCVVFGPFIFVPFHLSWCKCTAVNHLTPNGHYMGRTAQLTSRCRIFYIYSTNIRTEYFKHAA